MEQRRTETIDGFNSYIDGLIKDDVDVRLSLTQFTLNGWANFGTQMTFDHTFEMKRLDEVPTLTRETYEPTGNTPLYDAIIRTIDDTEQGLKDHSFVAPKVLIVIMTDGEENSSTKYNLSQVRDRIKHQETAHGWTFMYLGVEPAAWAQGAKIFEGTLAVENIVLASGGVGRGASFAAASASTSGYATSDSVGAQSIVTDEQKTEVEEASD